MAPTKLDTFSSTPTPLSHSIKDQVKTEEAIHSVLHTLNAASGVPIHTPTEMQTAIRETVSAPLIMQAVLSQIPTILPQNTTPSQTARNLAASASIIMPELKLAGTDPFRQSPNGAKKREANAQQGFSNPLYGILGPQVQPSQNPSSQLKPGIIIPLRADST